MATKITVKDLKEMDSVYITPAAAAAATGISAHWIRLTARHFPQRLGYPTLLVGNRVAIPRLDFIRFLERGIRG